MNSLRRPLTAISGRAPKVNLTTAIAKRHISVYGYEQASALTFAGHGEPDQVLKLHRHSISPAHGDLVTVKFLASPINPADVNQLQGLYPSKPVFTTSLGTSDPIAVGGNEGVAQVISKGNDVKHLNIGDWVVMQSPTFGTWRTHAQTTIDKLVPIGNHDGISPLQAATVSVNPCTAYRMLKDFGSLRRGDWFIQNGANSGVGRAAIQFGRLWGYKSINIIRARSSQASTDKLKQELYDLGADMVVTDAEAMDRSFAENIRQATSDGTEPIRLGLNCVGGRIVNTMCKIMAEGGHMVTYGAMSKQPVTVPAGLLIFKDLTFHGFWVSRWNKTHDGDKVTMIRDVLDLIREGRFKDVPVDAVKWTPDTTQQTLVDAVKGTLEGYRPGKSIFVFEDN